MAVPDKDKCVILLALWGSMIGKSCVDFNLASIPWWFCLFGVTPPESHTEARHENNRFVSVLSVILASHCRLLSCLFVFVLPPPSHNPFFRGQEKILREKVIVNANRVDFPPKPVVSEEAKSFIRSCLTYTHATRPDVHAMCNLPYLTTPAAKRGG